MICTALCATVLFTFTPALLQDARESAVASAEKSTPARSAPPAKAGTLKTEPPKAARFVLEKGDYEIVDLIEKSGNFLGRRYLLDKAQNPVLCQTNAVDNKITIVRTVELDAAECEDFVGQILYSKGWVAAPLDTEKGLYDWIWMPGPKGRTVRSRATHVAPEAITARPKKVEYVRVTIPLEHANAQFLSANLRTIYNDAQGMTNLVPVGQRSILVTGFRHQIAALLPAVRRADAEEGKATGKMRKLEDRIQKLEALLERLERRSESPALRKRG